MNYINLNSYHRVTEIIVAQHSVLLCGKSMSQCQYFKFHKYPSNIIEPTLNEKLNPPNTLTVIVRNRRSLLQYQQLIKQASSTEIAS